MPIKFYDWLFNHIGKKPIDFGSGSAIFNGVFALYGLGLLNKCRFRMISLVLFDVCQPNFMIAFIIIQGRSLLILGPVR